MMRLVERSDVFVENLKTSTLHQIGAAVRVRLGHCRSVIGTGGKGRYLLLNWEIMW